MLCKYGLYSILIQLYCVGLNKLSKHILVIDIDIFKCHITTFALERISPFIDNISPQKGIFFLTEK